MFRLIWFITRPIAKLGPFKLLAGLSRSGPFLKLKMNLFGRRR